ncbi:MAG TPA: hypothetical protein VFQ53_24260 [Kofleriaceae bacterium]|nr:hypothetical protein [Kofleriaceae bacterium]
MYPVRRLVLALACFAACRSGPAAPPVPLAHGPAGRTESSECTVSFDEDDPRANYRMSVLREMETVDRELDALDDELAASAVPGPQRRDDALAQVTTKIASLQRTSLDSLFEGTPALLVRIANAHFLARERDAKLAEVYGERHPDRHEQRRLIEALRASFDRQRDIELAEATALRDELAKLPKTASPAKLRQASRRALRTILARHLAAETTPGTDHHADAIVPSDAPAEVRVAGTRIFDAQLQIDVAGPNLGPKHPEMIQMVATLAAARETMRSALVQADAALAREIAALDGNGTKVVVDPARVSRRAELAARARDLRREWDALR